MALALTISIPSSRPENIATYPKDHRINRHFASRKDTPGADKENNWPPAPTGKFILMLRMYWPPKADKY